MTPADAVRFAQAARRLAAAARSRSLAVPGFRSPPGLPGADRTIRHRTDGAVIVAVRIHGRSLEDVAADMVEGVLVANGMAAGGAEEHRRALLAAALDDPEASVA